VANAHHWFGERIMRNRIATIIACWLLGVSSVSASSDAARKAFATDVETKCRAAIGKILKSPKIEVEPFGSESYGVAIGRGKAIGSDNRRAIVCIYDKKSKSVEIGGELRP
jgi:hypothetical protein